MSTADLAFDALVAERAAANAFFADDVANADHQLAMAALFAADDQWAAAMWLSLARQVTT